MFESAIDAAEAAARSWLPQRFDAIDGTRCCRLCLVDYRGLVVCGPLEAMPHVVAHAFVERADQVILARIEASWQELELDVWAAQLDDERRNVELLRRGRATARALTAVAGEELDRATDRFLELRRAYTEPAITAYLNRAGLDEVPTSWLH